MQLLSSPRPGPVAAAAPPPTTTVAAAAAIPSIVATAPTAAQGSPAVGPAEAATASQASVAAAPTSRRYNIRVGPVPPSLPYPRPTRRASPSKRAQTSGPGESLSSRPRERQSPPTQGPTVYLPLDLSLASIIRRPYFHCNPIPRNADCSERDLHNEIYYDLPAFSEYPELRDSMRLVQRNSMEPFMTPRQFFFPRVVIDFYHTMTFRQEPNQTAIHFSIDGRPRILRATDIAATFNLPVVLSNLGDYRQWPHPSTREMVRLLSRDTTVGSILFRRLLPSSMLLIDHILWFNIFPLQHIVQRRGAILEALYRMSEGF